MSVIRVDITRGDCLRFSYYFTNYPTCEELLGQISRLVFTSNQIHLKAFVMALKPKRWVIVSSPRKIVQFVRRFGVLVGKIEMVEVPVVDCVGFYPTKTHNELGRDAVAEAIP